MLRWVIFSLLVIAFAAVGTAVSQLLIVPAAPGLTATKPTHEEGHSHKYSGPPGKAVVVGGTTSWNFGVLPQKTEGSHEWTIANEGQGVIELEMGQTTCSCTYADLKLGDHVKLNPGEKKKIKVSFNTKEWDRFHQTAPISVHNDPDTQSIDLTIDGDVRPAVVTFPNDKFIPLATVNNDGVITRDLAVFSFDRPGVKILESSVSNPDVMSVQIRDMTPDEAVQFKIKEGRRITLTMKPSPKLGQFTEELTLKLDHPAQSTVKFTVTGNRVGPISIFPERVRLFNVSPKDGAKQTLTVLVRNHENTKFSVEKTPKSVTVDVAPMGKLEGSNTFKYQVTVNVPPDMPTGTLSDEILIKTDHPSATEIKIPVAIVVSRPG